MPIILESGPSSETDAGIFNLPPSFDRSLFAAQWFKKGMAADAAKERQSLLGTRLTADGWSIFMVDRKPVVRLSASGEFVLMFRPRDIQVAVCAIYGNVGKERMLAQKRGEKTTGGVPTNDGQLAEETLSRLTGERERDDGEVRLNPVALGSVNPQPAEIGNTTSTTQ